MISKMIQVLLVDYKPSLSTLRNVVDGLQKSSDIEELNDDKDYIDYGRNMFNLKTFKVYENDIKIFPKTRLNLNPILLNHRQCNIYFFTMKKPSKGNDFHLI